MPTLPYMPKIEEIVLKTINPAFEIVRIITDKAKSFNTTFFICFRYALFNHNKTPGHNDSKTYDLVFRISHTKF